MDIRLRRSAHHVIKAYEGTVTDEQGVHAYTVDINNDVYNNERTMGKITWVSTQPEEVDVAEDLITMQVERILL